MRAVEAQSEPRGCSAGRRGTAGGQGSRGGCRRHGAEDTGGGARGAREVQRHGAEQRRGAGSGGSTPGGSHGAPSRGSEGGSTPGAEPTDARLPLEASFERQVQPGHRTARGTHPAEGRISATGPGPGGERAAPGAVADAGDTTSRPRPSRRQLLGRGRGDGRRRAGERQGAAGGPAREDARAERGRGLHEATPGRSGSSRPPAETMRGLRTRVRRGPAPRDAGAV